MEDKMRQFLKREQELCGQYSKFATQCQDVQIKSRCEQIAAKHQNHADTLDGKGES